GDSDPQGTAIAQDAGVRFREKGRQQDLAGQPKEDTGAGNPEQGADELIAEQDRGAGQPEDRPDTVAEQRPRLNGESGAEAAMRGPTDGFGGDRAGSGGIDEAEG